jgi:hypothetical protein
MLGEDKKSRAQYRCYDEIMCAQELTSSLQVVMIGKTIIASSNDKLYNMNYLL